MICSNIFAVMNTYNKKRGEARIERLKYKQKCLSMIETLIKVSPVDLGGAPLTSAKRMEFLFVSVNRNPKKRLSKLRLIFMGKFSNGDHKYIQTMLDWSEQAHRISYQISKPYFNHEREQN
jgi:hypothetical protein